VKRREMLSPAAKRGPQLSRTAKYGNGSLALARADGWSEGQPRSSASVCPALFPPSLMVSYHSAMFVL